jgi:signal transduction histidine kinase
MKITVHTVLLLMACVLTVAMLTTGLHWSVTLLASMVLLGSVSYWALRVEHQRQLAEELAKVTRAYDQLDAQAKLIIRTDVELQHTQEQLDRKLSSLVALQALSQRLRISLHPEEICAQLTASLLESFGFSKGLLGLCPAPDQVVWHAAIGLSDDEAARIGQQLTSTGWLHDCLLNPAPRKFSAQQRPEPAIATLLEACKSHTIVLAGLAPQAGPSGCLLLAREGMGMIEWKGDEELVAILATQLATALENSALYEEVWTARQVLERKVQERTQELAAANAQLMRLNKAKSEFVSAVSHELRTPLSAIKGYASLLRAGQFGRLESAQTERLAKIEKHADLLTSLINNLLDIARIASGRVTMERQPIDARELVTTALEAVKPQLDAKQIHVAMHLDGVHELLGDPTHLPRVLVNLLSNAAKYTPEHGTVEVSLARDGSQVRLDVRDTGCGIDPADVPKLFQEFYRSAGAVNEHVHGTGLGLALAKRIVEAHQGTISVRSTPEHGSTFTVTLPA